MASAASVRLSATMNASRVSSRATTPSTLELTTAQRVLDEEEELRS